MCNLAQDSPNVGDRVASLYVNMTMSRESPAFACPTWVGGHAASHQYLLRHLDHACHVFWMMPAIALNHDGP
jgi:hypothetical protein